MECYTNKEFVDVQLTLVGLPDNLPYEDTSTLNLCTIYYEYLNNLVNETKERFSNKKELTSKF